MSGFDQIDEAVKAGARAENADFATPTGNNGIAPFKFAKRKIYIPVHFSRLFVNGSITSSFSGTFPGKLMPNAASSYMLLGLLAPRGEVVPGEPATLHIYWTSATTTGDVRFVLDMRPVIEGATNLASAFQRAVISTANGSANQLTHAKLFLPPAIFSNDQQVAMKLARDPANTLDTHAADIVVRAIYMEILGKV